MRFILYVTVDICKPPSENVRMLFLKTHNIVINECGPLPAGNSNQLWQLQYNYYQNPRWVNQIRGGVTDESRPLCINGPNDNDFQPLLHPTTVVRVMPCEDHPYDALAIPEYDPQVPIWDMIHTLQSVCIKTPGVFF
jgi:hypothetical protein